MEKNKELTPMMELIEWVKTNPNINISNKARIIEKAKSLLPKEKQFFKYAYCGGCKNPYLYKSHEEKAETYYNTKYNNQIK